MPKTPPNHRLTAYKRSRGPRSLIPHPAPERREADPPTVRVADLFAGIGGFHLASREAGGRVVFAAENNAAARMTYTANFEPTEPELFMSGNFATDIRGVEPEAIPAFDVLAAGFPCQPFSEAGSRRGLDDPRGALFFEIVRILDARRPAAFVLENVRGLLTLNAGRTFSTLLRILRDRLGYTVQYKVVRASDFGLPQLRPRVFIVGFREPGVSFEFPEPIPLTTSMDDVFGGECDREIGFTVLASGRGKPYGVKRAWDAYLVDGQLRRVGVREARIMQGFPEDFVFPVSDAHAMQQLGNAVAVPPTAAIIKAIVRSLRPAAHPRATSVRLGSREATGSPAGQVPSSAAEAS